VAIESVNPATGEKIRSYAEMSGPEVSRRLQKAQDYYGTWKNFGFDRRASFFRTAAEHLRVKKDDYAKLMALEMGKPFAQGQKEANKCAWVCEFYAENAEKFLSPEIVETDASKSYVAFEPLGIILAVMPWNFPFWQVFRAAVPAMMAGNVVVLKHASNVPGCAEMIEKILLESGLPEGGFTNLAVETSRVPDLIAHPFIKAVTLTGSVAAGKAVASKAGSELKKVVLELGGSDPYVILEDADLEQAVSLCGEARLLNTGQSCVAAKRFIVVGSVYEKFLAGLLEYMKKQKMGDPMEEGVTVGPMARADLRDEIHRQVERSVKKGAKLVMGGRIPERAGAFYPPTVLADVKKGMPAFDEEIFGPVAAVIRARDEREAIALANDSFFGLGAAVFTRDVEKGERIAREELKAGCSFVNAYVKSDPRLPFGGVEQSGYGRELGIFGIREFVNIKTVYVK
jgi:succinate-semialdehyde dehydrogenase/glutarate-semialdehyde dehydrogenase